MDKRHHMTNILISQTKKNKEFVNKQFLIQFVITPRKVKEHFKVPMS